MRRTWPLLVSLAISGGIAGTAIAGLPASTPDAVFVIAPETITNDPDAAISSTTTVAVGSEAPTPVAVSTPAVSAPAAVDPAGAVDPAVDAAPPTTILSTTLPPVTMTDRADITLVIANGDPARPGMAADVVQRMTQAGYGQVQVVDNILTVAQTTVYYRPGFDDEAWMVSGDLLMPAAPLEPAPANGVTSGDSEGDLVIILGPDFII
ncbi:MAG: cell envelope-related function transcriptional attenuator common domain protein [Ilumatobacteraceae bacterium]|nr:cell envelope-related function transcriptional attenuator common domain protein [Ilumatobacteraceae bacterium]